VISNNRLDSSTIARSRGASTAVQGEVRAVSESGRRRETRMRLHTTGSGQDRCQVAAFPAASNSGKRRNRSLQGDAAGIEASD
jgi:hypothetical protein